MSAVQKAIAEHICKRDYGMPGDDAASDAIDTIATRMAAEFDVGELLEDLYGGGDTAGALRRLIGGRCPWPGDESSLRRLLGRVEWLAGEVEKEMSDA